MYKFILFAFCVLCALIRSTISQSKQSSGRLEDLYLQCRQNGGHKLCLGTGAQYDDKLSKTEEQCVKQQSCTLLLQFELIDKDNNIGEHCLYLNRNYRDQIRKERKRDDDVAMIGVRFGEKPIAPVLLESTCFLGQAADFIQIYYPDKSTKKDRIKKTPAFENSFVHYDNEPMNNNDNVYCCFRQSLNIRIQDESNRPILLNLDKKDIYLSLIFNLADHNKAFKSEEAFNLTEYEERKLIPTTTTTTTTTTSTTTNAPTYRPTDPPTTTVAPTTTTTTSTIEQPESDTIRPRIIPTLIATIKPDLTESPDQTTTQGSLIARGSTSEDANNASSSKVLIIFALSIVLLAFFLLIALSLYNVLGNK